MTQSFWDSVSSDYDKLYLNKWSRTEDTRTKDLLIRSSLGRTIVDVGGGTGLGTRLLQDQGARIIVNVDASHGMLDQASRGGLRWNVQCEAESLGLRSASCDSVIMLNGVLSYCDDPAKAIIEAKRVLRPGGNIMISALGRHSLRRLLKMKFRQAEKYSTRGCDVNSTSVIRTFSARSLKTLLLAAGFSAVNVTGISSFAGVWENPRLLTVDGNVTRYLPNLSHILYSSATRADGSDI